MVHAMMLRCRNRTACPLMSVLTLSNSSYPVADSSGYAITLAPEPRSWYFSKIDISVVVDNILLL